MAPKQSPGRKQSPRRKQGSIGRKRTELKQECKHFEVGLVFEPLEIFEFFEPLEKPSSLNEGGSTNGST